jgi:hypothetical protein
LLYCKTGLKNPATKPLKSLKIFLRTESARMKKMAVL